MDSNRLATDSKRVISLVRVSCDISSSSKSVGSEEEGLAAGCVVLVWLVRVAETSLVISFKLLISSDRSSLSKNKFVKKNKK